MSESLITNDIWANPAEIERVLGLVERRVVLENVYSAMYDIEGTGIWDRRIRPVESVYKLSDRLEDKYLKLGVTGLFRNWNQLIENEEQTTEGNFGHINSFAGTLCLAARYKRSKVTSSFNTVAVNAYEITHPLQVIGDYWRTMKLIDRVRKGTNN